MDDPEPSSSSHWDEQLTPRILIIAGSDSGGGPVFRPTSKP
jgi:hypothetical protein